MSGEERIEDKPVATEVSEEAPEISPTALEKPSGIAPMSPLSFMLIVASGLLFIATVCPTVFVGDAGDFITACYKGWIPHPPGYPLYTILGHLMTLIPTGFCADSTSLIRFTAILFLTLAGVTGVILVIANRARWGGAIVKYLGYMIGGLLGIILSKTLYAFFGPTGSESGASSAFDFTNPPAILFGLITLLFFIAVLLSGYVGARSKNVRGSTYIVSLIIFAILTPLIFLLIKYVIPQTIDPINCQPAVKVNMLSAIGGFLTVIFAYLALREVIPVEAACGIGAFLIGIGRTFWAQATIAEVYTINTTFIFIIFYLGFSYVRTRRMWRFYLMAFLMGLALAHHYSILLFYPGLLYYLASRTGGPAGLKKSLVPVKRVAIGFILAIIGLAPYYYLSYVHYETALEYVVFNKDEAEKLRSEGLEKVRFEQNGELDYFLKLSSRGVYTEARAHGKTKANLEERTTTPEVFSRFVQITEEEFTFPIALFGLLGFLMGLKFRPGWLLPVWLILVAMVFIQPVTWITAGQGGGERLIWFMLASALTVWCLKGGARVVFGTAYILYFGVVHFFPSEDILNAPLINLRVVMPPLVVPLEVLWGCFAAFFIADIYDWVKGYTERMADADDTDPAVKIGVYRYITIGAFLALTIFAGYVNWPFGDKSKSLLSYNYARNVLDSCDPLTVVMTTGDEIFIFWYIQEVEGYRPDVRVTNWIHNIYALDELGDEMHSMAAVMDRFIQDTDPTAWNLASTYIVPSFLDFESIQEKHVAMDGLLFKFEKTPPIGYVGRPDFGGLPPGDRMQTIDEVRDLKLDPKGTPPLTGYYWGGVNPLVDSTAFEEYEKRRVTLDPQEHEMLARYQDTFLHAGIYRLQKGRWFEDADEPELADEQFQRAAVHFRSLVSLDPADVIGWPELGETYLHLGIPDWAEICFRTILDKENADNILKADAHGALAMMYLQMGEPEKATQEAVQALILNPDNPRGKLVMDQLKGDGGTRGGDAGRPATEEEGNDG